MLSCTAMQYPKCCHRESCSILNVVAKNLARAVLSWGTVPRLWAVAKNPVMALEFVMLRCKVSVKGKRHTSTNKYDSTQKMRKRTQARYLKRYAWRITEETSLRVCLYLGLKPETDAWNDWWLKHTFDEVWCLRLNHVEDLEAGNENPKPLAKL